MINPEWCFCLFARSTWLSNTLVAQPVNSSHSRTMSWKLNVLYITFVYYIIWVGLPIFFKIDPTTNKFQNHIYLRDEILFPFRPSVGVLIPILIMLVGLMIIGTFLGVLCINQQDAINKRKPTKKIKWTSNKWFIFFFFNSFSFVKSYEIYI